MANREQYWSVCLYPYFLSSLSSCTLVSYTDEELEQELALLAQKAIARFKFPKVPLTYDFYRPVPEVSMNPAFGDRFQIEIKHDESYVDGWYFTEEGVTMKEILVIIAWMKYYWVEYQASKERNYENLYADKDVKAFSSGNLLQSIDKMFMDLMFAARKTEEDYSRVNKNGRPAVGDVNA